MAAYLVGSRGTAAHAVLLGAVVTASHTISVYALGIITLYASQWVVPERLYPWLGMTSGLMVAGLGFALFIRRYVSADSHDRDHHHDHDDHDHDHGHDHRHSHASAPIHRHTWWGGHVHEHSHEEAHAHGHPHIHQDATHAPTAAKWTHCVPTENQPVPA